MALATINHSTLEPRLTEGGDFLFRWANENDLPRMLELVRTALGEGSIPRTEAFWRWKHEQNAFGRSPMMLVETEGRIIALRVFLRWRWRYGDRTFDAVRPVDTATHPDWRRRGLFEQLTRRMIDAMREEGVAFVYNTPNPKSAQGYQKLGWQIVGRPTIWIRPLKPLRLIPKLLNRGGDGSSEPLNDEMILPKTVLSSPDLGDFLANRPQAQDHLVTDVDAAYLAWRYHDCSGLDYGADGAFDRHKGALLIYRYTKPFGDVRELRLCDLFVAADTPSKRKAKDILRRQLRISGADFASVRAMSGTPAASVLRACGFLPAPYTGPVLAYRPLTDPANLPAIERLPTWGSAIGDLELF